MKTLKTFRTGSSVMLKVAVLFAVLLVAGLAGCSSDDPTRSGSTPSGSTPSAPTASGPTPTSPPPAAAQPTATPTNTPVPEPTILRYAAEEFGSETLDPTLPQPTTNAGFAGPLWDWLTYYVPGEGLKPGFATSWEQSEDGLSWTFELEEGATFHDGTPVTASDVRFTLMEAFRREEARTSRVEQFKKAIMDVEVVDSHTVRVITNAPAPTFPFDVSQQPGIEGIILPEAYIKSVGWDEFARNPIGSGPWKFVRHESGNLIEFEAHEGFRDPPQFDQLHVFLVPEESSRIAMLETDEADIAKISVDKIESMKSSGFTVLENPEPTTVAILFFGTYQPEAGSTGKLEVRQALNLAINRQEIIDSLYQGNGVPAPLFPVTPDRLGFPDDLEPYPFDPERAKQLLAGSGDEGFPITIFSTQGASSLNLAQAVASYWSAIGVNVTVEPIDIGVLRPKYVGDQDPSIFGHAWAIGTTSRLNGAQDLVPWWGKVYKILQLADNVDELALAANAAPTQEQMEELTRQAYRVLHGDYRAAPIAYVADTVWAYGNGLGDVSIDNPTFRLLQPSLETAAPAN